MCEIYLAKSILKKEKEVKLKRMWHLGRPKEQEGRAHKKQTSSVHGSMGLREYLQPKDCGQGRTKVGRLRPGTAVQS